MRAPAICKRALFQETDSKKEGWSCISVTGPPLPVGKGTLWQNEAIEQRNWYICKCCNLANLLHPLPPIERQRCIPSYGVALLYVTINGLYGLPVENNLTYLLFCVKSIFEFLR